MEAAVASNSSTLSFTDSAGYVSSHDNHGRSARGIPWTSWRSPGCPEEGATADGQRTWAAVWCHAERPAAAPEGARGGGHGELPPRDARGRRAGVRVCTDRSG